MMSAIVLTAPVSSFFRLVFVLLLIYVAAAPCVVNAKSGSIPAVMFIAPEEVRTMIAQHFPLPDTLLKNELERSVFMRRAGREIPALLETEGYFSSKVVLRSVLHSGMMEVQIVPGPRTTVEQVEIEFQGAITLNKDAGLERMRQLRADWLLPIGMAFTAEAWDRAKTELLTKLLRKQYASARIVDSVAKVDSATARAKLRIVLDSGHPFKLGELHISGLVRYSESLVMRYASFKSGDEYDRDQLLILQTRLQNLAQFNSVVVALDMANIADKESVSGEPITVPVNIHVEEAQSRKLSVGLGYSTNNGAHNELNYVSNNFMDRAWGFKTGLVMERNRQTLSASVDTLPNPQGFRVQWNASGERTDIQGLETFRDKFGVTRSQTVFGNESSVGLSWQHELGIPLGGVRDTNQALVLEWTWTRRTVDDPLMPMNGSLTQFKMGGAGKTFLSDEDFVRSYLRHQSWFSLGEDDVVSLRGEAGYTQTPSRLGIPQEYLFRVGGTQTVRGFAYQSLGVTEGSAVVGGRAMTTASVEYTHWFNILGMAAFVDAGDAADTIQTLQPSVGYGVGARWRSPVGPLALDVARSRHVSDLNYHFSIAVAF